jgi:hypothetical protein
MLEDIFRAEATALHRQFADHDTDDFMHRLAVRIAEEAAKPARVQLAPATESCAAAPTGQDGEAVTEHSTVPLCLTQVAAPAQTPPARTTRPNAPSRGQRFRRGLRRRPTPIITTDPTTTATAVIAHVRRLCEVVLRSNDIDRLADFAADYDQAGARTFACLLYTLDRRESALYWWRFAAGAGDPLAAHLLAAHHAAVGRSPDARLWRAFARMMGFTTDRHLPQPVRPGTDIAEGFAYSVPWDKEMRTFMQSPDLPRELAAH